jgi:NADPH-dependent curcumin reductase CurA
MGSLHSPERFDLTINAVSELPFRLGAADGQQAKDVKEEKPMTVNRRFLLVRRPDGEPVPEDFRLAEEAMPAAPEGGFVVRNHYASLDPAQRGWMDDAPSYMPPIGLGDPVRATTVGVVSESKNAQFRVGQWVLGMNGLEDYSVNQPGGFTAPIDVSQVPSPSLFLSGMGAVGLTGYFGLLDGLKP